MRKLFLIILIIASGGYQLSAQTPGWAVPAGMQYSMTFTAELKVSGALSDDVQDTLAVFVGDEVKGIASPILHSESGKYLLFLTVYSDQISGENLTFKVYDKSADEVIQMVNTSTFSNDEIVGAINNPYLFTDNHLPSAIQITEDSVSENLPTGTALLTFSTVDDNANDEHTYKLVDGDGDDHNDWFYIDADTLKVDSVADFESLEEMSVRVRSVDSGNDSIEVTLNLIVKDENDAPTKVFLSDTTAFESLSVGDTIGSLSTEDQDGWDTHFYSLVSSEAGPDHDFFEIKGDQLVIGAMLDYELKDTMAIEIAATDSLGLTITENFEILVIDQNDAPTGIRLSNDTIVENSESGIQVAVLLAEDQDSGDSHAFSLVDSENTNNDLFTISGRQLILLQSVNYELTSELSVLISVSDETGATFSQFFEIHIRDMAEALTLDYNALNENSAVGSYIGLLSTEGTETATYAITKGGEWFSLDENRLISADIFDFETGDSLLVSIESYSEGDTVSESFAIHVLDQNEPPEWLSFTPEELMENMDSGSFVGLLAYDDPDLADSILQVSLLDTLGGSFFGLHGDSLLTKVAFDFESKSEFDMIVSVSDGEFAEYQSISIQIKDKNEAPVNVTFSKDSIFSTEAGSLLGFFQTEDPDMTDTHQLILVNGEGDDHNDWLQLDGVQLLLKEDLPSDLTHVSFRLEAMDQDSLTISVQFVVPVKVQEQEELLAVRDNSGVLVYPNPTASRLQILSEDKIESVQIMTVEGKLIDQHGRSKEIDVSELKSGVYLLQIVRNGELEVIRFMKQ